MPTRALPMLFVLLAAITSCGRNSLRVRPGSPPATDADVIAPAIDAGMSAPDVAASVPSAWRVCATLPALEPRADPRDAITGLTASRDGRWLAASRWSEDPVQVSLWQLGTGRGPQRIEVGSLAGLSLEFSPDSARLAAAGDERGVYKIGDGQPVFEISPDPNVPGYTAGNTLRFSPGGTELATGETDKWVTRLGADGRMLSRWPSAVPVPGVAFSPDGTLLATSVPELWRLADGRRLWAGTPPALNRPDFVENSAEFSPDGATLLVSTCLSIAQPLAEARTQTRLVRVSDGAIVADLGGTLSRRPTFAPDGAQLVAGSHVMNLATRALVRLPVDAVLSVYLPDGRIAAAGQDGLVHLVCPVP